MIQRTYFCDGPPEPGSRERRCRCHATTASPPPHLPKGIIEVRERCDLGDEVHHFCGWDCLMKFAADQPIPEIILPGESSDEGGSPSQGESG